MSEQHEKLMKVREAQLQRAHAELARRANVRNGVNHEIEQIEAAILKLASQRASWNNQWHDWTQEGGALQRGKAYADQHLKIAALENDLAEERARTFERLQQAQQEVDVARAKTRKQHEALSQITDVVARMQKKQRQEQDAREVQRAEDSVAVAWYMTRKTVTQEARNE